MSFTSLETWFLLLGAAGTTYLALRVVALLFGGVLGDHGDAGAADPGDAGFADPGDADVGAGHHAGDDAHHHEGARWLTLQGLAAFAMGFGWLGLSLLPLAPVVIALLLAALFGTACAVGLGWATSRLSRMESSGTFHAERCVGRVGTVYRRIRAGERGAVQVEAQGRLVTMPATADVEVATGDRVLVFDVTEEHVLRVEPWQDDDPNPAKRGRGEL